MMGWGTTTDTFDERMRRENDAAERIEAIAPHICKSSGAKPVINKDLFDKIIKLMESHGIEQGLDLTYIEIAVFGDFLEWLRQLIGSCVASGEMRVSTCRMLWEVFILGELEELFGNTLPGVQSFAAFAPYSYRAGRRLGNMNSGDGSYCSVHIEGMLKYGKLPCFTPGLTQDTDTLPEPQNENTYRRWGSAAGNALMDKYASTAKRFLLTESERNTSDPDLSKDRLITEFKPSMICSDWAFKPDYQHPTLKNPDGSPMWIFKRDTADSWAHNMSIVAFICCNGQWFVKVRNSWGMKFHKGWDYFVIPIEVFVMWLKSQNTDSRTIGNIVLQQSAAPIAW
jgi:hypothetical protein